MDEGGNSEDSLHYQIEQLQRERDELRKDIEQLCMQQAGPSYLAVATKMHFQRTAGLEQEIENLKRKLAGCIREKQNLQEELSEAYHIKSQLADLHAAEILKNKEAEKQVKFFQGCVAAAFAERDNALMESEKAKEREEVISEKLIYFQNKEVFENCRHLARCVYIVKNICFYKILLLFRLEELESAYLEEKKLNTSLQVELDKLKKQSESCEKVTNKFYVIRERDNGLFEDIPLLDKCKCLLDDPPDKWVFNNEEETSTSKYIASLEEEKEAMRNSVCKLQKNLQMGLKIEQHLKRNVQSLEKRQIMLNSLVNKMLSVLRSHHSKQRLEIRQELHEASSWIDSMVAEVQRRLSETQTDHASSVVNSQGEKQHGNLECGDVHVMNDVDSILMAKKSDIPTNNVEHSCNSTTQVADALAQALQEKVAALLLLSQQDERQLLERDLNKALEKKIEELQRNLSQVTNEKVGALMELAELKRNYQILKENNIYTLKQGSCLDDPAKSIAAREQEGRLKNILKRTYLKRWVLHDQSQKETNAPKSTEESSPIKTNNNTMDFARLKVENVALQESIASLEHLTSSIHRLHILLLKVQEDAFSNGSTESLIEALSNIVTEANQVKTAMGNSLPLSWSADEIDATACTSLSVPSTPVVSNAQKLDTVSAAGKEMAELLILAAQLQKENLTRCIDLQT